MGNVPESEFRVPAHRNAEVFAGKLIGAGTAPAGMCVWPDGDWDRARFDRLDARALGAHSDIAWLYHIDLVRKAIWLFGDEQLHSAPDVVACGTFPLEIELPGFVVNPADPPLAALVR